MNDDLLVTGVVRGSHGVDGSLKIASLSGEFDHFRSLKEVTLRRGDERRVLKVESVRIIAKAVLVRMSGIGTPEEARKYTNWEVLVPRSEAATLSQGEYYVCDLIGCRITHRGEPVGEVVGHLETGTGDLLEVGMQDGVKRFVPFRNEFFGEVDIARKEIPVNDGFFEE
jgi:16S rRNA processing protein RimM